MLLIASQLVSSSPLCLFGVGVLSVRAVLERSSVGRALFVVMLAPLSTLAGWTGFPLAGTFDAAGEGLRR
nr:hypothetical protein [Tanacetum cinerariifolium]